MLAVYCLATAFMPSSAPLSPTAGRSALVSMKIDSVAVSENFKAGGAAVFGGTVAAAPVKAATALGSKVLSAQVAFGTFSLAVQLAFFGVIYRYVVRCDADDTVKQGTVGMFACARALQCIAPGASTIWQNGQISSSWTPELSMQLGAYFGEGCIAFAAAAALIEYGWKKGWASPLYYLDAEGFEELGDVYLHDAYDFDGRVLPSETNYNRISPGRETTYGSRDATYGRGTAAYGRDAAYTDATYGRGTAAYGRDAAYARDAAYGRDTTYGRGRRDAYGRDINPEPRARQIVAARKENRERFGR